MFLNLTSCPKISQVSGDFWRFDLMIFHGEPPDFTHGELDLRDPGANGIDQLNQFKLGFFSSKIDHGNFLNQQHLGRNKSWDFTDFTNSFHRYKSGVQILMGKIGVWTQPFKIGSTQMLNQLISIMISTQINPKVQRFMNFPAKSWGETNIFHHPQCQEHSWNGLYLVPSGMIVAPVMIGCWKNIEDLPQMVGYSFIIPSLYYRFFWRPYWWNPCAINDLVALSIFTW